MVADDPPARATGDFALNLPDAEVGGRGKCLDLPDNPLRDSRTPQVLSSRLGGSHTGGDTFADERGDLVACASPYIRGHILRFGQYALDMGDMPQPLDPQPLPFEIA